MPGEIDPRLINLLQGVMGFSDALRDAGAQGDITIRLGRQDGLRLLDRVAGSSDPEAEAWSQKGRPPAGANILKIAGLTFEWPQAVVRQPSEAARLICSGPVGMGAAANENSAAEALRFYGFEEEKPASR